MMFPMVHGLVGGVSGLYTANGVNFDGTFSMNRGAGLTGASDGKLGTVSVWFKTSAVGEDRLISSSGSTFDVIMDNAEKFQIEAENSAGTDILFIKTAATVNNGAWRHGLASWDLTNTSKRHLYLDDASDLVVTTYTNDVIDYTVSDWGIGGSSGAGNLWDGCIADVWFDPSYLDLSITANRRKFIDASGSPVDLGSDGSIPTGSSPLLFFSGVTANWHTNKGSGGGFTENGVLTDCGTDP